MNKSKNEVKDKKTYDVEASMKSSVNLMFTQMKATQGFNLSRERAMADTIKEFKKLKEGSMTGEKVVTAIDPYTLSAEDKAKELNAVNLIKKKRRNNKRKNMC